MEHNKEGSEASREVGQVAVVQGGAGLSSGGWRYIVSGV